MLVLDNKGKGWRKAQRPANRRLVQLYCALLYNANLKGFPAGEIYTGKMKGICVPGLNCYSCPGAIGACPLGALQNACASSGSRAGTYIMGILLLFGLLAGRTICGWLCPMGLIQELLYRLPTRKLKKGRATRVLSGIKYGILAVFVLALPLWYGLKQNLPLPAFCKYICPAGTLEGAVGLLRAPGNGELFSMLGILFTRKVLIMLGIGLCSVFAFRFFCRFLCPLGAIYSLFSRAALIGVRVDPVKCNHCGNCVQACKMDVRKVGDRECIHCGQCMETCLRSAISIRVGSRILKGSSGETGLKNLRNGNEKRGQKNRTGIFWGAWLLILCLALFYFNLPEGRKENPVPSNGIGRIDISYPEGEIGTAGQKQESESESSLAEEGENRPQTEAEAAFRTQAATETEAASESGIKTGTETAAESEGLADTEREMEAASELLFQSDAPVGSEPGQQLADFTIETTDGESFHLRDSRGHVTILNLWATYCTPCVQEIPYFARLKEEHPKIHILAVHSSLVTEDDVAGWIKAQGWERLDLSFAVDTPEDLIWNIVDGSSTLPQTIALNARGEVIYNMVGSISYEKLSAILEKEGEE